MVTRARPPVERVRWCAVGCGAETVGGAATCRRCGRATVDLGYRVGWHAGAWSYYSSIETLPKEHKGVAA